MRRNSLTTTGKSLLITGLVCRMVKLSFLTLVVFLVSCQSEDSEDVNQDRIYVTYECSYDAKLDVTSAKAVFRFGSITGTKLELTGNSFITFNGKKMSFGKSFVNYESEVQGYLATADFEYNDNDGNVFVNTVKLNRADLPDNQDLSISQTQPYEIVWDGLVVAAGEEVVAQINPGVSFPTESARTLDDGASSVRFEISQLAKMPLGNADLTLKRSYHTTDIDGGEVGGSLTVRYTSKAKEVTIVQ